MAEHARKPVRCVRIALDNIPPFPLSLAAHARSRALLARKGGRKWSSQLPLMSESIGVGLGFSSLGYRSPYGSPDPGSVEHWGQAAGDPRGVGEPRGRARERFLWVLLKGLNFYILP